MHDRIATAANGITLARLLGLPLFAWLVVGARAHAAAFVVLAAVAATDWVDGYVARRFDQVTRLGRVLDPLVDRLLLATAALALLAAGVLPWWLVALVVGRDAALLIGSWVLFSGLPPIPVSRLGKVATACLLIGVPGLLLGSLDWWAAAAVRAAAWVVTGAGVAAYYLAAVQYAHTALPGRGRRR